jgi:RNA polymerase-binding protein DksA
MDQNEISISKDPRSIVLESLLSRKAEVEKSLKEMRDYHRENKGKLFGDDNMEEVDRAGKEISNQTYYGMLERKTQELQRLESLVEHISQNEEFGICEECGEEIGYERLMAMPDVTRCIECQRDFEKNWARDNYRLKYSMNHRKQDDWDIDDSSEDYNAWVLKDRIDYMSNNDLEEVELAEISKEEANKQKAQSPIAES